MTAEVSEISFDVSGLNARAVNDQIRSLVSTRSEVKRIRLSCPEKKHNLLNAVPACSFVIDGDVGDYCAAALRDADVEILGTAETGLGHSLQSGVITIRKDAGLAVGAMASGGLIVIHGSAGARCGAGLQGADILVEGSVGSHAGAFMRDGTMVILGDIGPNAGYGASGGTWYVVGEVHQSAPQLTEARMKESDKLRLGLLLLNSGVDANAKDFRKYVIEASTANS